MNWLAHAIELIISQSRWLIAPFLVGLVVGLGALAYKFVLKLVGFLSQIGTATEDDLIVAVPEARRPFPDRESAADRDCRGLHELRRPRRSFRAPELAPWSSRHWLFGSEAETARPIIAIAAVNVLESSWILTGP